MAKMSNTDVELHTTPVHSIQSSTMKKVFTKGKHEMTIYHLKFGKKY